MTRILDALPQFAAEEQGARIGPQTMQRYLRILRAFAVWLDDDAAVLDIAADLVRRYQGELAAAGRAPRTIRLTLSAIRAFCRWAIRAQLRADDPTLAVVWPKIPKTRPRPLAARVLAQLADVLEAPRTGRGRSAWQWQRNVRCITLMLYGGLRLGDACRLDWDHVDLDDGLLYLEQGKGRKDRVVPIHARLDAVLRRVPPAEQRGPVVGSRGGAFASEKTLAHIFERWLPQLGVTGVKAHRLRHTCATELRRHGADLKAIQAVLGHESLATTELYLGDDPEELRAAIDRLPGIREMGRRPAPPFRVIRGRRSAAD